VSNPPGSETVARFGESEAADEFAARQRRQPLKTLRFGTKGEDRQNHQRGLHAHHRAKARIDALHLACDQAVADLVETRAAVFGIQRCAEHAQRSHLAEIATSVRS